VTQDHCGLRIRAALLTGTVAGVVNTFVLKAADFVPLSTAKGGLLRLIRPAVAPLLQWLAIASTWSSVGLPTADSAAFQIGFHLLVGLMMALVYGLVLERLLPYGAFRNGMIYAAGTWLINAGVVLPLNGEGFAGIGQLSIAGIVWFAAAHLLFFLLLAVCFAQMLPRRT
jgi:hypothetical protein